MKIIQPPGKRSNATKSRDTLSGNRAGSNVKGSRQCSSQSPLESAKKEFSDSALEKKLLLEETSSVQQSSNNIDLPPGKRRRRSELDSQTQQVAFAEIDPAKKEFNRVLERGIRLLSVREHSVREMYDKLAAKTENVEHVTEVIDLLVDKKYLSDERFTEAYVRARGNRGFGPMKIRSELINKGISSNLIAENLDESSGEWLVSAERQYQKKFGEGVVVDYKEWSKRARFLQSRGFSSQHIQSVIPQVNQD